VFHLLPEKDRQTDQKRERGIPSFPMRKKIQTKTQITHTHRKTSNEGGITLSRQKDKQTNRQRDKLGGRYSIFSRHNLTK
jgi:hypothetical protein